jgi:MFS family permease
MAVLYFTFSFSSFLSTAIVGKLGMKLSLIIGGLCYFFWVFCFLAPAFYADNKDSTLFLLNRTFIITIVLIASAINGFGAGILWVSCGKYISECACDANKGVFNAIFWSIFMMSQILGNLIGGLVLNSAK